jgi:flagellar protein FlaG
MDINSLSGVGLTLNVSSLPQRTFTPATQDGGKESVAAGGSTGVSSVEAQQPDAVRAARAVQDDDNARQPPVDEKAVQESVDKLNEFVRPYVTSLRFSIDKDLGEVVVKIMDDETQEIIKQFPSEEALVLAKALDKVKGLLVKQKA